MASLVLGGIGGYLFGPIGFAIGSAIGGLFDQTKQEGPRLTDKRLQGSTYGENIPIVYGTMRLSGQVIWAPDLVEHKHDSGGKGGPKVTTYTYTGSFDVLICESNGNATILGCNRIWADGTLIYDTTPEALTDNSQVPVTFYFGDEAQQPDPTEEAVAGVGNVPAYRGYCRAVFADWDLGTFGNRIPTLTFEVFTGVGDFPSQVSLGRDYNATNPGNKTFTYDAAASILTVASVNVTSFLGTPTSHFHWSQWDVTTSPWTQIGVTVDTDLVGYNPTSAASNSLTYMVDTPALNYYWAAPDITGVYAVGSQDPLGDGVPPFSIAHGGFWYGPTQLGTDVAKWQEGGSFVTSTSLGGTFGGGALRPGIGNDGSVWLTYSGVGNGHLWKFDSDLNLIHAWTPTDLAGTLLADGPDGTFMVYNNYLAFSNHPSVGTWEISVCYVDPHTFAVTDTSHQLTQNAFHTSYIVPLNDFLGINETGIFSLLPPLSPVILGDIVADISERSGLVTSQFDTSTLIDLVDGYLISRQSSGRDNIQQLRTAYFFDGVESSAAMRFVKRGLPAAISIPDSDLAAQVGGRGTPPPLATITRTQETDLPATIYTTYFNIGANWQNGTQYSRRLVTNSRADARVDLPIAMTDQIARAISAKLLWAAWLERTKITILTPRKYAYFEPTDVITAHGWTFRVDQKNNVQSDIVQFEGVATMSGGASVFNQGPAGVATSGNPTVIPPVAAPSGFVLYDLNLVTDGDSPNGIYCAMYPSGAGSWPGGTLYESSDGGTTYIQVGSDASQDVVGTVATALGDFGGKDWIFDQTNSVTVVLTFGGTLSSSSRDAILASGIANLCLVGSEMLQFTTATLIAANTYTLTGLLRGRRGTDAAIATHDVNEPFLLLPTTINTVAPFSDLGATRSYKGITTGGSLSGAAAQSFVNNGNALRCYAPVHLGGGRNAAGDIHIQWTRRTRIGGAWLNFTDVPVSETAEQYLITFYSLDFSTIIKQYTLTGVVSMDYTVAQQTADYGGAQDPISWSVQQLGSYQPGYFAFSTN